MVGKLTPGRVLFNILNTCLMIFIALCCVIPLWHVVIASISDPGMVEAHTGIILWPLGKPSINGYLYLGRYPKSGGAMPIPSFMWWPSAKSPACWCCWPGMCFPQAVPLPQCAIGIYHIYHAV